MRPIGIIPPKPAERTASVTRAVLHRAGVVFGDGDVPPTPADQ